MQAANILWVSRLCASYCAHLDLSFSLHIHGIYILLALKISYYFTGQRELVIFPFLKNVKKDTKGIEDSGSDSYWVQGFFEEVKRILNLVEMVAHFCERDWIVYLLKRENFTVC